MTASKYAIKVSHTLVQKVSKTFATFRPPISGFEDLSLGHSLNIIKIGHYFQKQWLYFYSCNFRVYSNNPHNSLSIKVINQNCSQHEVRTLLPRLTSHSHELKKSFTLNELS